MALRPLLFWTLDEIVSAGLRRAIVVTNPEKPIVEAVARDYGRELVLEFVSQDVPRGLGDALLRAETDAKRVTPCWFGLSPPRRHGPLRSPSR